MLPTPAWLAAGVVVASVTALAGCGVAGAAAVAAVAGAGACACAAADRGRPRSSANLAAASLGAALIVARLALESTIGAGAAGAGGAVPIPPGAGSWPARVESAHISKGQQIATIAIADPPIACSAEFPSTPRLIAGDTINWTGRIRQLTDGEYDQYLAAQGLDARCEATNLTVTGHDYSPAGRLEQLRQSSGDALQLVLPEPAGGLAAAILIGLRDRVDRDLAAAFTTAGVSHVVAISGWNIAIVAATVAALLRRRTSRRKRAIVTMIAIVGYTLFAGASASVVRAAVMAGVAMAAIESGRGGRAMVGLGWAAVVMIVAAPATVGDVGFQLSAAATAGLIAWATPLTEWLGQRAPRLPCAMRESLGISLAAQASTLPIALLEFGRLALIAPAANLVVVPIVAPVMAAGAAAFGAGGLAALGAPAWLTAPIAMPAAMLLEVLIAAVRLFASVPGANETLPPPFNLVGALIAAGLLVGLHRGLATTGRRAATKSAATAATAATTRSGQAQRGGASRPTLLRYRWLAASAILVAAMLGPALATRPDGAIHVVVLDVGQGDAILLQGDHGGRILIDGGPDANLLMSALDEFVPPWDRRLDAIILTHPHDDHLTGLIGVMDRYKIGRAFESGWAVDTPGYRAWETALSGHNLTSSRLRTGATVRLDDATLRVLWPDDGTTRSAALDPTATSNRKTNDASIVLLGDFDGRRFLLTGDAEDDVDPILLERGLSAVDVLKVPHHGSATASSEELLAALRPAISVISVGANNTYGHPNGATLARLRAHSSSVARTDLDGTVDVALDRAAVTVTFGRGPIGSATAVTGGRYLATFGPLYDSAYDRPEPSPVRGLAPIAGTARLAPSPLTSGCRGGGVACPARGLGRALGRSPPGRISRATA